MEYFKNQTIENFPEFISTQTVNSYYFSDSTIFNEDVMDENQLDDWTIDDFLIALPKIIQYGINNIEYSFNFKYDKNIKQWSIGYYNNDLNKIILEITNIDQYECFKQIYIKLKTIDKL